MKFRSYLVLTYYRYNCFAGASCPDGASFLPDVAGSIWIAKEGIYNLKSCPAGYQLVAEECLLCPAASYCLGGIFAPVPCANGLFSSPGSNSSASCKQVVFVVVSISFPVFISDFSSSEQETLKQYLADTAEILPGNVQETEISQTGFGQTLVVYKLATDDAIAAAHLRLKLSQVLLSTSSITLPGLSEGFLQSVTVTSCPPGYNLQVESGPGSVGNDGLCVLCPAGYYCRGGSLAPIPCPTASYSPPGANSSSACTFAIFVIITTTLHIPQSNFTSSMQKKFILALSSASGTANERVSILSITSADESRRLAVEYTRVESQIAANDAESATSICNLLDSSTLNSQLSSEGLPAASLDSVSVLENSAQSSNSQLWIIALVVVCGVVALLLTVLLCLRRVQSKADLTEESDLWPKILEIRKRLELTPNDGVFLISEKRSFWSKGRNLTLLRKNHLEAAGRLALFRNFDTNHFDAFCISLYTEQDARSEKRYRALCEWLLELSEQLINPETVLSIFIHGRTDCTTADERFRFFVQKVAKARIWHDDEELFVSLKAKAHLLMGQITIQCDLRYQEFCTEPRGDEVISLTKLLNKQSDQWIAWKGHSLLRILSSGFYSFVSSTDGALAARETDSIPEMKSEGSTTSFATLSRQDHPEVNYI